MAESRDKNMSTDWGNAIDISEVQKARRGATVQLDQSLLDFLQTALNAGQAVALSGFQIDRKKFKTDDAAGNEKQRIGAVIRRHVGYLRDNGLINNSKVSIAWHPELELPQVYFKSE